MFTNWTQTTQNLYRLSVERQDMFNMHLSVKKFKRLYVCFTSFINQKSQCRDKRFFNTKLETLETKFPYYDLQAVSVWVNKWPHNLTHTDKPWVRSLITGKGKNCARFFRGKCPAGQDQQAKPSQESGDGPSTATHMQPPTSSIVPLPPHTPSLIRR